MTTEATTKPRQLFVTTALPCAGCGSLLNAGCSPSQNSLKEGAAQ